MFERYFLFKENNTTFQTEIMGLYTCYPIADGLVPGFIFYPLVKLMGKQGREVNWLMYFMSILLIFYFLFVRMPMG